MTYSINDIDLLKNFLSKLLSFYNDEIKYVLELKYKTKTHTVIDKAVFLTLSKITKSCRAVIILSQGYGEDAAILARSMFEGVVALAYILKEDSTDRAILFSEFDTLDYYNRLNELYKDVTNPNLKQAYQKVLEKCDIKNIEKIIKTREDKITQLKSKGERKLNKKCWSFFTIKQMALGTGYLPYYKQIYWQISKITHSQFSSLEDYIEAKPSLTIYNDVPSDNWVTEALFLSSDFYLRLLRLLDNYVGLNLNKRTEEYDKEFNNIAKTLNQSP